MYIHTYVLNFVNYHTLLVNVYNYIIKIMKGYVIVIPWGLGMSGLPDMYTRSPRAAGPRAEGVHIRQTTNAHGITVMCHIAPPLVN